MICKRFKLILTKLIEKQKSLNLKQVHLCEWTNSKFNELNTLNLSNINQINKLLNKFNRIERLKLKLNCSDRLDFMQLNSSSTQNLKEFYLLTNCDSIYRQTIYLQILNVESLTIYCNRYEYLQILSKLISFLNHFKKVQYFSSNLKHCSNEFKNETFKNGQNQNLQFRNHTLLNLHLSSFSIDLSNHLDLVKSFTKLQKLTILTIKEELLDKFVYQLSNLSHLIVHHLNSQTSFNLEHLFASLSELKKLKYLNLTIHQLKFDLKLRLILFDFLLNRPQTKLIINSFEINNLNEFQAFLSILPSRIRQTFNLKHLTGEELNNLNYCSSSTFLNRLIYSQVKSLVIRQFICSNQLNHFGIKLKNLHYLEIREYFGNTDELILALLNCIDLNNLKTIKLIKVNLTNANTFLDLTKLRNIIHLEIELKFFKNNSALNNCLFNSSSNDKMIGSNQNPYNKSIQTKNLINALYNGNNSSEEKQLINNLYSFVKFDKLQKLILNKFKLTTSLLLYLLDNCPNLYLINVDNCTNVDKLILKNAIKNKFALCPILNK